MFTVNKVNNISHDVLNEFLNALSDKGVRAQHLLQILLTGNSLAIDEICDILIQKTVKSHSLDKDLLGLVQSNNLFFGLSDWERYFNVKFDDDAITECDTRFPISLEALDEILNSPCPHFQRDGVKIKNTHFLFFLPHQIISPETKSYLDITTFWSYMFDCVSDFSPDRNINLCEEGLGLSYDAPEIRPSYEKSSWHLVYIGAVPDQGKNNRDEKINGLPEKYTAASLLEVFSFFCMIFLKKKGKLHQIEAVLSDFHKTGIVIDLIQNKYPMEVSLAGGYDNNPSYKDDNPDYEIQCFSLNEYSTKEAGIWTKHILRQ